eukprot:CAMPEP_0113942962 /NCGR_PEP_ID=MMETSP1339-20121228/14978_1 /TAXON_ID=94617 /ORGANISM="Fibrocapsa japonica" /LENGTH=292 /DNA_ID=CAMNT_0000947661 /DNA_START=199 /DNA_END=1077 /DNA_ORIENTATION=+ /assembly_acc=CAM_ASM_000762
MMVASKRAPTLPSGEFRPKQSLGQNYLSDMNYILKIVNAMTCDSSDGQRLVELGPGMGALTRELIKRYPAMTAIEVDPRAIEQLNEALPDLTVIHSDVLQVNWPALSKLKGGPLSVVGNLPYHITSQILFGLADNPQAVRSAVVTTQWEVAQRICSGPNSKDYGILSVVFQLFTRPRILFKIPNTVFYPAPKVASALIELDFSAKEGPKDVDLMKLKKVISAAFQQRRKMLRRSLQPFLQGRKLPEQFEDKRPEQLKPQEFVELTKFLYGEQKDEPGSSQKRVFRKENHGDY